MKTFLAIAALLGAATAHAGLSLNLDGGAPTFDSGIYTYNYKLTQSAGDVIRPDDYFTIYDFTGLITTAPKEPTGPDADWNMSYILFGLNTPNVTFTWTGAGNITSNSIDGFFTLKSTVGNVNRIEWQGRNEGLDGTNTTLGETLGRLARESFRNRRRYR